MTFVVSLNIDTTHYALVALVHNAGVWSSNWVSLVCLYRLCATLLAFPPIQNISAMVKIRVAPNVEKKL